MKDNEIIEITAPNIITPNGNRNIFLAGTIDMGNSEDWQKKFMEEVKLKHVGGLNILNPRREFWKSDWKQDFDDPNFSQQVNWELDAMEKSNFIFVNILPESKSPVTMMEFGIHTKSDKLIVCCPKQFYRSGNIHIVCDKYYVPLFNDYDRAFDYLIKKLNNKV